MVEIIQENWYYLAAGLLVVILLTVIICLTTSKKKGKKDEAEEDFENVENEVEVKETSNDDEEDEEITFETTEEIDSSVDEDQKEKERHLPKKYRIIYEKENKMWVIKKDGAKRVIRRVKTKAEALKIAKELCKNQELNLSVQKRNGKFQKMKY